MENIPNFKQIGASVFGALAFSTGTMFVTAPQGNMAESESNSNPVNSVLVQPAECSTGKCNCKLSDNTWGRLEHFLGKQRCMKKPCG